MKERAKSLGQPSPVMQDEKGPHVQVQQAAHSSNQYPSRTLAVIAVPAAPCAAQSREVLHG